MISCNSQSNTFLETNKLSQTSSEQNNGIVYFSLNNGESWINASEGLPQKTRIGLGGIATSKKHLGIATKDKGVYLYDFKDEIWKSISTHTQIIESNIGSLAIFDSTIFVGTQYKGIFMTNDLGKSWKSLNQGLGNMSIRRFYEYNQHLYVCTNDGFYVYNESKYSWDLEFGQELLQTNGATSFNGRFFLATNKGIFSQNKDLTWSNTSPTFSMHNISSDSNKIYAMTYNDLLLSSTDGKTWESDQAGLPKDLYTFNVLNTGNAIFAGQWDGIYKKNKGDKTWKFSSLGLPNKFAVTNFKSFKNILVISTSERK
jgi:ligand-binding sensor domain-containing protein